jgi:hypothetical protein
MTAEEFIRYVRKYAQDHYENSGWDEVVEAWDDLDIIEYYDRAGGNDKKAFKALARMVKIRKDYAEDIVNA